MTPLPEGLQAAPSAIMTLVHLALGVWAALLLLAGRRFPRFAAGSFYMAVAVATGWGLFASVSYPLALFAGWVAFSIGMLVNSFVPRLSMAFACAWVLPAIYGAHLFFAGSFGFQKPLALGLLAASVAMGAVSPRFSLGVLSSAMGALLLVAALPYKANFWWPLAVAGGGILWQTLALPRLHRPRVTSVPPPPPNLADKRRMWLGASGWGAAALAILLLATAALAPVADATSSPNPKRVEALRKAGGLARPSLLFSAEDAYYLFGRPLPVAIIGPRGSLLDRLLLPVLGCSPSGKIGELRTVKDEGEVAKMRIAAAITSKAFEDVAPLIKPGANEADLEKAILASFERNGANGIAFRCVVGSGRNATLPHYMDNNAELKKGLIVIDIGCSVDNYASDMTRTFPVDGKWTEPERRLLDTVVAAGDAARAMLKPGVRYAEMESAARKVIEDAGFGEYFTHGLGHPVGLDVHDSWIRGPLKPGMVVTIEPGIYIPAGSKADTSYWDLGVRVEDSYLVTKDGYEELTHYPKIPGSLPPVEPQTTPKAPEGGAPPAPPEAAAGGK